MSRSSPSFASMLGKRNPSRASRSSEAHQLDVAADADELPIDRRTSSSQSSSKDRQILMSRAKSLLLVSVLTLVVAACGGGGDSGASSANSPGDITPPITPADLVATAAGGSVVNLMWSASTDNVAVTGYVVKRNGVQIGTPTTPGYSDIGLSSATTYGYTVAARDAAGNISPDSASVSATTADTIAPSTPTNLTAVAAGAFGTNLTWNASTDNVGSAVISSIATASKWERL